MPQLKYCKRINETAPAPPKENNAPPKKITTLPGAPGGRDPAACGGGGAPGESGGRLRLYEIHPQCGSKKMVGGWAERAGARALSLSLSLSR